MQLIGMPDSPYVRRVAIALQLLGMRYEHRKLSVFRHFDAFAAINPVVKAPTLVCDDGTVLSESSLILQWLGELAAPGRGLLPATLADRQRALRITGLALAACEKSVQVVYERSQRPPEKQHAPWLDRVRGQLAAAYRLLEGEFAGAAASGGWLFGSRPSDADVTAAVAWRFTLAATADCVDAAAYPALARFSAWCEAQPAFIAVPLE